MKVKNVLTSTKKNKRIIIALGIFAFMGLALRIVYAQSLPITNDEGAYLYDGLLINQGFVPYRDFLTKAPVFIYTLAVGVKIFGVSLWVGRGLAIFSSLATAFLIFFLAREIFSQKAAFISAVIFMVFPTIIFFTTYAQTQTLQIFFVTLAFLLLLGNKDKFSLKTFFLQGLILAIAFFTRKTSLVLLFVTFITILFLFPQTIREKIKAISAVASGFGLLFLSVFGTAYLFLSEKAFDLVGGEVVKQVASQKSSLGIYGTFVFLPNLLREVLSEAPTLIGDGLLLTILIFVFLVYLIWNFRRNHLIAFPLIWFLSLALIYFIWIKFRTPYFIEFLPPLVLMAGAALVFLWDRIYTLRKQVALFPILLLIIPLIAISFVKTYKSPYTGSIPPKTAYKAADFLKDKTENGEEVLTAVAIIPFLSGNNLPYNLSHPTWYGIKSIPDELLLSYFPAFSEFERYVKERKVKYILLESTTEFSFFDLHPEFEDYVLENYNQELSLPLVGLPLRILRLKDGL